MIKLKLSTAAKALNAKFIGKDVTFIGAHNDTRELKEDNLFIAITGPNFDGHDFIESAKATGAAAVMVTREIDIDIPQLIVKDTTEAMGQLAKYWRDQFDIPFVGITGSVGKTTTRQMTGAILSQMGKTLISEGNKNNFYGVPLTLFRLGKEHHYAVIEMGADRPNDITYLVNIVRPQVATVTMVAPVHIEVKEGIGFGSVEGVLKEKTQIFSRLSENGIAVLNADSPYLDFWNKELSDHQRITFGLYDTADVTATDLRPNDIMQYEFTLHTPIGKQRVKLSSLGRHNVQNALCASAMAIAVGASLEDIRAGLANVPTVARRMISKKGYKGSTIIDDSYNANSVATHAVLDMLADYQDKKRIMVFGDMRELGNMSEQLHREIGEHAKETNLDYFFAYGPESRITVEAIDEPYAKHFKTHEELAAELKPLLDKNTIVVVKGSLGMHMNKVIELITEEN